MRSKYLFLIIIFFLFIFSCSNPILTDLLEPLFPEECKICIVTNTATCTTSGLETRVCSKYKQHEGTRNVNALGHDYSDLTQTTPPTCIARGIKTGTCIRTGCFENLTQDGDFALGHDLNWVITISLPNAPSYVGEETGTCQRTDCNSTDTRKTFNFSVGDTGPGGGTIFYVADGQNGRPLGFTVQESPVEWSSPWIAYTAHYLEFAPDDASLVWAPTTSPAYDFVSGTSTAIFTGRRNTAIILAAAGTDPAANAPAANFCATYGTPNDWFLPSANEIAPLRNYNRDYSVLPNALHWSSSQNLDGTGEISAAWAVNSFVVTSGRMFKHNIYSVRPIRAF